MKEIKLVLVDLDGTLLDDQKRVSSYTVSVLKRLKNAGIQFGICTGRPPFAVERLLKPWNMEDVCSWIIGFNGGMILDRDSGSQESFYKMDGKHIKTIFQFLEGQTYNAHVFEQYEVHTLKPNEDAFSIAKRNLFEVVEDGLEPYYTSTINKLLTSWKKEDLDKFLETHSLSDPNFYMVRSTPTLLEFLDPRVTKGQAIQRLAKQLNLSLENILSFGDERNDLDMLQTTTGVAMKNSNPLLFEHTNYKTEFSNNEDGVARFLEQYILEDTHGKTL